MELICLNKMVCYGSFNAKVMPSYTRGTVYRFQVSYTLCVHEISKFSTRIPLLVIRFGERPFGVNELGDRRDR